MTRFESQAPEPVTPPEAADPATQSFTDVRAAMLEQSRSANIAGVKAHLLGNFALAEGQFAVANRILTERSQIKPQR